MRGIRTVLAFAVLSIALFMNVPTLTFADKPAQSSTPTPTPIPTVIANNQWTPIVQSFDGVDMVLVPPGCFLMGISAEDAKQSIAQAVKDGWTETDATNVVNSRQPQTKVCFDTPFWLDKTEVTQGQFKQFGGVAEIRPAFNGDQRPVESITWFEARDFCAKRGVRLPTEAEWEYASRGPDALVYPWGNEFIGDNVVYGENSDIKTADVGSKPKGQSWVGALDLSGNVFEWMSSIYKLYPYDTNDGRESLIDTNSQRVIRGGSWTATDSLVFQSVNRGGIGPAEWNYYTGFRCARFG